MWPNLELETNTEDQPENRRQPLLKDTEKPLKAAVKFTQQSKQRRNVNKCIVRYIFKNYGKDELTERYKKHGLELDEYITKTIDHTKNMERKRDARESKESGKKDYKKLLRSMLCHKDLRTVIKCCIIALCERIEEGNCKGIKKENRKIYTDTLKDYLEYIETINSSAK